MPQKLPDAPKSSRTDVTFVVFNGPAFLDGYGGFVNRIDLEKEKPEVLVNSAKKVPATLPMYIEHGVLYVGKDKFPLNGGKVVQFR